jgi:hypothetical protein
MFYVHDPASESHRTCCVAVVAQFDVKGSAGADDTDLDSSVEATERVCQEVRSLLVKVHSTFERVRDMVVPNSTSITIVGIIEDMVLKDDGEDPLDVAVRQQVTTGSESVFTMPMMHGVECDFEKITSTYPKGKDGRGKSAKDFLEQARELATRLALFLADRNTRRKAACETIVHKGCIIQQGDKQRHLEYRGRNRGL